MLSSRFPRSLSVNRLSAHKAQLERQGITLCDLTVSNPTRVGLIPPDDLMRVLQDSRSQYYEPDPFGLSETRCVVNRYLHDQSGNAPDPSGLFLTSSTSDAYGYLAKLLVDPGGGILVPQPSYPLFEHLFALEGIRAIPYLLKYDGHWYFDRQEFVADRCDARAIVLVNPNNPTGCYINYQDHEWIVDYARCNDLAIISDEVFFDYVLNKTVSRYSLAGESRALTFCLGGLSKSLGLPQMKLGWIAVSGPEPQRAQAIAGLEFILDTYLPVSAPIQYAALCWIQERSRFQNPILERLRDNIALFDALLPPESAISRLPCDGGWTQVLRIPRVKDEESLVLDLLQHQHMWVHPGHFYDFDSEAYIVVSLLTPPDVLETGIQRLLQQVNLWVEEPGVVQGQRGAGDEL